MRGARAAQRMRVSLLAAILLAVPAGARAQGIGTTCERGDLEVRRVEFDDNHAFRSADLARVIVTTRTSWFRRVLHLPIGAKRCLDTLEVRRDAFRIRYYYRQRGYWRAEVGSDVLPLDPTAVAVRFRIAEGPPVMLDSLVVTGLDSVRNGARFTRELRAMQGKVFNRLAVNAAVDSALERLRNNGYARADNLYSQEVSVENRASVNVQFIPGRLTYLGAIQYDIRPSHEGDKVEIPPRDVDQLLAFKPGDLYRQRDLLRSQQRLYQRETYRSVDISIPPSSLAPSDTMAATHTADTVPVFARFVEADMHALRVGVGWATLDCFRTQARYVDRNFLGGARRLELNARLSKIGVGVPLDGFPGLCTQSVRDDPFSVKLNYYLGATFRPPTFFGQRNQLSLTAYSERRSDFNAYLRDTPIGALASVTRDLSPTSLRTATLLTVGYRAELGSTQANQAVFCEVFNLCSLDDIAQLGRRNILQVGSISFDRYNTDSPLDPRRGTRISASFNVGRNQIGGAHTDFNKAFGEVSHYVPLPHASVLAMRVRVGLLNDAWSLHPVTQYVPPDERLYAGGPESVRGFQQNGLGPLVYVVQKFKTCTAAAQTGCPGGLGPTDTILVADPNDAGTNPRFSPTGGNALLVANLEWRTRAPFLSDILQLAFFADAGQLWNRPADVVRITDMKVTPGAGIRVASPVGPFRLDVAYNPYRARAGAAYFVTTTGTRELLCTSPGNTLQGGRVVGTNSCPATFAPSASQGFFQRLTFHFSLGQAF